MSEVDERDRLISQVTARQHEIGERMAFARSMPLLASTLTMQQLKTMVILSHQQDVTGHELAKHLGVRLGTVTGIVDRLVAQRLVDRREDARDRRVRRISLTTEGRDLLATLTDTGVSQMRGLLEQLDTDTLRQFVSVMSKLADAAQAMPLDDADAPATSQE